MKIVITAQLETSNHDGYCSGDECEYESRIVNEIVDIWDTGVVSLHEIPHSDLISLLPKPRVDDEQQSMYCERSPEVREHGLDVHDYRYTIIAVNHFTPDVEAHNSHVPSVKRRKVSNNHSN